MTFLFQLEINCHPKRQFRFVWWAERSICSLGADVHTSTMVLCMSEKDLYRDEGRSFHGDEGDNFNKLLAGDKL